jgi:hypothetical protein
MFLSRRKTKIEDLNQDIAEVLIIKTTIIYNESTLLDISRRTP